jgi:hypothetical protein
MKSGNRMSEMSSDSKLSSTFDKESDTSSAYSDYSEFQDSSSTYAGNSTDSTTVQVNFDHWGERDDHALTSTLQRPPFSPRVVAEHQRQSKYADFPNCAHDFRAMYIEQVAETGSRLILVNNS